MSINAETYRDAAIEHAAAAFGLYEQDRFALAHYVSGLAVECILRAYRVRKDPAFDARHDLNRLWDLAKFTDAVPARNQERLGEALSVVVTQWANDHRYRSEQALRKWLSEREMYEGIKGDFVKERTRRIVNAATDIVNMGARRWTIS